MRALQRTVLLLLAIIFICFAIFPIIFLYGLSLMLKMLVNDNWKAKIEAFWDVIGAPYDYLIKRTEA